MGDYPPIDTLIGDFPHPLSFMSTCSNSLKSLDNLVSLFGVPNSLKVLISLGNHQVVDIVDTILYVANMALNHRFWTHSHSGDTIVWVMVSID